MSNVIVVVGPGQIGQAIARRVGVGKHVLLADMREENANAAAEVLGNGAGLSRRARQGAAPCCGDPWT
jgi:predicted dinucleotide-binding enzyme